MTPAKARRLLLSRAHAARHTERNTRYLHKRKASIIMTWHTLYPHDGRAFRLPCGCVNITIHRWNGKGDWWLTCVEADYVAHRLDTEDVERAKSLAVKMVRKRLQEALDKLSEGGE